MFGSGAMTNSIEEISKADAIFIIGSNTSDQHPLIGHRVVEAVERNAEAILAFAFLLKRNISDLLE